MLSADWYRAKCHTVLSWEPPGGDFGNHKTKVAKSTSGQSFCTIGRNFQGAEKFV